MQNIIDSVHTSNKDTYRSDFHHQISVRCCRLRSYMVTVTVACVLVFLTISENKKNKNKNKKARYFLAIVDLILLLVCLSLLQQIVFTTVTKKKKKNGNRPVEEAKSNSQAFVAHSFTPKRFTHLCRALYGDAILVHIAIPFWCTNMAAGNQQKHLEFIFSIKALSFHSRTSIRTHKHIFLYLQWLYC